MKTAASHLAALMMLLPWVGSAWADLPATQPAGTGPAPATQPAAPAAGGLAVQIKVLTTVEQALDSSLVEPWINEQAGRMGAPNVADRSGWVDLAADSKPIATSLPTNRTLEAKVEPTAGGGMLATLGGSAVGPTPRQVQLIGREGERYVIRLADLAEVKVLLAVQVVVRSARADAGWGELAGSLRVRLKVDPIAWTPGQEIKLNCTVENVSDEPVTILTWGAYAWALEFIDARGQSASPAFRYLKAPQSSPTVLRPRSSASFSCVARVMGPMHAGGPVPNVQNVVMVSGAGGSSMRWPLPPGDYTVRAVMVTSEPGSTTQPARDQAARSAPAKISVVLDR